MSQYALDPNSTFNVRYPNGAVATGFESYDAALAYAKSYKGVVIAPDGVEIDPSALIEAPVQEASTQDVADADGAPAPTEEEEIAALLAAEEAALAALAAAPAPAPEPPVTKKGK